MARNQSIGSFYAPTPVFKDKVGENLLFGDYVVAGSRHNSDALALFEFSHIAPDGQTAIFRNANNSRNTRRIQRTSSYVLKVDSNFVAKWRINNQ